MDWIFIDLSIFILFERSLKASSAGIRTRSTNRSLCRTCTHALKHTKKMSEQLAWENRRGEALRDSRTHALRDSKTHAETQTQEDTSTHAQTPGHKKGFLRSRQSWQGPMAVPKSRCHVWLTSPPEEKCVAASRVDPKKSVWLYPPPAHGPQKKVRTAGMGRQATTGCRHSHHVKE